MITGEGRIDDQTLHGKLPYVVAQHAAPRPTYAVAGLNQISPGSPLEHAFTRIHQISDLTDADTRDDLGLTARILTQLGRAIATQLTTAPTPISALRGASDRPFPRPPITSPPPSATTGRPVRPWPKS